MIERSDHGNVAILKLAHGKASALDLELLGEIQRRLAEVATSDARAVVLTGTASIFSAGVDLFRMTKEGAPYVEKFFPAMVAAFTDLFLFPRPVIAAINGHAIAGGAILSAAADYRVMTSGKATIGIPELVVGVPFPAVALEIVRFGVPQQYVQEMVYRGRIIDAETALGRGIVEELAAPESLLDRAIAVAGELAQRPRDAFRLTKQQLRQPYVERAKAFASSDREALEFWSAADTHRHIREYLDRTVGRK